MVPLQIFKSEKQLDVDTLVGETGPTRLELPQCNAQESRRITISIPGEQRQGTGSNTRLLIFSPM